jgi:hypothetical protein
MLSGIRSNRLIYQKCQGCTPLKYKHLIIEQEYFDARLKAPKTPLHGERYPTTAIVESWLRLRVLLGNLLFS